MLSDQIKEYEVQRKALDTACSVVLTKCADLPEDIDGAVFTIINIADIVMRQLEDKLRDEQNMDAINTAGMIQEELEWTMRYIDEKERTGDHLFENDARRLAKQINLRIKLYDDMLDRSSENVTVDIIRVFKKRESLVRLRNWWMNRYIAEKLTATQQS